MNPDPARNTCAAAEQMEEEAVEAEVAAEVEAAAEAVAAVEEEFRVGQFGVGTVQLPPGGGGALSGSPRAPGTSYGGVRGHARVSICGGPPSRDSPCKHVLILLKDIPGYKGFEPNPNPSPITPTLTLTSTPT